MKKITMIIAILFATILTGCTSLDSMAKESELNMMARKDVKAVYQYIYSDNNADRKANQIAYNKDTGKIRFVLARTVLNSNELNTEAYFYKVIRNNYNPMDPERVIKAIAILEPQVRGSNKGEFNARGYDAEGYDKSGLNEFGYDRNGYNKDGFNVRGYDVEGYNRKGFDGRGYDRNGYNRDNLDKDGYDKFGYDVHGLDVTGYDKNGYDYGGYGKNGLSKDGWNRDGMNASYTTHKYGASIKNATVLVAFDASRGFTNVKRVKVNVKGAKHTIANDGEPLFELKFGRTYTVEYIVYFYNGKSTKRSEQIRYSNLKKWGDDVTMYWNKENRTVFTLEYLNNRSLMY